MADRASGPICARASAAPFRTPSLGSWRHPVKAGTADFASGPISPKVSVAPTRTASSVSRRHSRIAGIAGFASGPMRQGQKGGQSQPLVLVPQAFSQSGYGGLRLPTHILQRDGSRLSYVHVLVPEQFRQGRNDRLRLVADPPQSDRGGLARAGQFVLALQPPKTKGVFPCTEAPADIRQGPPQTTPRSAR